MMKGRFFKHIVLVFSGVVVLLAACVKDPVSTEINGFASFRFNKARNPSLVYDIVAEIVEDTLRVHTFAGTDLTALIPDFEHDGQRVTVAGTAQESGITAQNFTGLVDYVVAEEGAESRTYTVKFEDTGLSAIYLSTDGQPIPNREDYVAGNFRIVRGFGNEPMHQGTVEVRGRGNSTWGMPKKPYRLKLTDAAPLLGMPTNRHWALMANYGDKSLMRNDVAFEVSRRLGLAYTPRQRYADFFLNGEYMGNYNLTEHIREGSDRVDIDEDNGGYILEADGYATSEPVYFITPGGMPVTIKFPDEEDITSGQRTFITDYYTAFENSLFSENFVDPVIGYQQYFDLAMFVNYYLANEICGNPDMWWSMRMYKKQEQDPLIYTGPVWDFDLAFNNDSRLQDAVRKLMLTDAHEPRQWINRIAQDPDFRRMVRERWNSVKTDVFTINAYIDQQADLLQRSQVFNFRRWNILQDPAIHLNWYLGPTYQDYVNFLKSYFDVRLAWLDETINGAAFDAP